MATKLKNNFEKRIHRQLKRSKVPFKYESVKVPYILARHYIPDFILDTELGKVYIECKGYLRPEDKSKLVAVKKCNPHMDIRILFYADNKRYIKWAIRHGFKYAIWDVPKEWLKGM